MRVMNDINGLISPKYPNLIERIRLLIEGSEQRFSQHAVSTEEASDSFLWEHTVHVAALARKIALVEAVSATDAVIAALFHDSGKFLGGHYHDDEIPEEETAADLAQKMLTEEGMNPEKIDTITAAVAGLYSEKKPSNKITDVVHDADFLAKFGYLGIANFFTKSALRKKPLYKTLIASLSKELTYAAALKANMRTEAGKRMAEKKSEATQSFYTGLLDELREAGIAFFNIKEESFACPDNPDRVFSLRIAVPEHCPECSNDLSISFAIQRQTKCEQLTAKIQCVHCPKKYQVSFCLPEMA
jgi:HD superfamily phosphodiesterase